MGICGKIFDNFMIIVNPTAEGRPNSLTGILTTRRRWGVSTKEKKIASLPIQRKSDPFKFSLELN